ncbi:MAG: hypothetical protein JWM25_21, partial [Thermoleophilia bacterium]|nr:hypothetical protein [Thermoleophilia bacterium]
MSRVFPNFTNFDGDDVSGDVLPQGFTAFHADAEMTRTRTAMRDPQQPDFLPDESPLVAP